MAVKEHTTKQQSSNFKQDDPLQLKILPKYSYNNGLRINLFYSTTVFKEKQFSSIINFCHFIYASTIILNLNVFLTLVSLNSKFLYNVSIEGFFCSKSNFLCKISTLFDVNTFSERHSQRMSLKNFNPSSRLLLIM